MMASLSQLEQAGQSEASEPMPHLPGRNHQCSLLGLVFPSLLLWLPPAMDHDGSCMPTLQAAFHRILQVLPSDDKEEEDRACFSASHQRNVARERCQSRSPLQH